MTRTISELLDDARARIERFEPAQALAQVAGGAVIVDIRSRESRQRDGVIPGAVHVPRTVLEWRAAPSSEWRNPQLDGKELILVCDHGYSSALAAATLAELGRRAGEVIGGFEAWAAAGLPIGRPGPPPDGLPGMGAAD